MINYKSNINFKKVLLNLFLIVLALNLAISLVRQLINSASLKNQIKTKQEEAAVLESKNIQLKKQLELVQNPLYIKEKVNELSGKKGRYVSVNNEEKAVDQLIEPPKPNYLKWKELFLY